jgi:putative component of membrane protein insertase Oxa1/YidC/SpoIIIJ protein YidD
MTVSTYARSARSGPAGLLSIALIKAYQRHLSPIKGYCCAYRIRYGGPSCSAVGVEAFSTNSFSDAILILRSRFGDCQQAAKELEAIGPLKSIGVGCCGTGCSC